MGKQNLLMNFIIGWFIMIGHFVTHFLFLDGLIEWSETVECPCPVKKEIEPVSRADRDLMLNAVTDKKKEETEVCYCKLGEEEKVKQVEDKAIPETTDDDVFSL